MQEDGTGSGYGPYVLAEKRAHFFGTLTDAANGGLRRRLLEEDGGSSSGNPDISPPRSKVNDILLRASIQGRDLIQQPGG